jgi:hypothetical protein
VTIGPRTYRVLNLDKCTSRGEMHVNVKVSGLNVRGEWCYHGDPFDMESSLRRAAFIKQAAHELATKGETIHREVGQLWRVLADLQASGSRCYSSSFVFAGMSSKDPCARCILQTSLHLVAEPTPNANSRSAPRLNDATISGFPLSSCHSIPASPFGYICTNPPSSRPATDSIRCRMESISGVTLPRLLGRGVVEVIHAILLRASFRQNVVAIYTHDLRRHFHGEESAEKVVHLGRWIEFLDVLDR